MGTCELPTLLHATKLRTLRLHVCCCHSSLSHSHRYAHFPHLATCADLSVNRITSGSVHWLRCIKLIRSTDLCCSVCLSHGTVIMSRRQPNTSATASAASSSAPSAPQTPSLGSINSLSSFLSYLSNRRSLVLHTIAFFVLLRLAALLEFTSVYLCVAALYFIFLNLNHSSPTDNAARISAYSAFNTGGARMAGSMGLDSWEGAYRPPGTAPVSAESSASAVAAGALAGVKPHPKRTSKAANQPCVCGSGKKYKNCCSKDRDSERSGIGRETDWLDD